MAPVEAVDFWSHEANSAQVVAEHARELKLLPGSVVGEWSLSRQVSFCSCAISLR